MSRKLLWMAVAAAALLVVASVADSGGFRRYLRLEQDVRALEQKNALLAEQNDRYREEIEALRSDRAALERAAREELGFVKTHEIVLNLE